MLKSNLLEHQHKTVDFLLKNKVVGDWSTMGTGKSLSALASIVKVKEQDLLSDIKAVIVCPPFLCENWLNECSKHTTLKATPHFIRYNPEYDIYIVPYTQLEKAEEVFKNCSFWVADESQALKNLSAQRTMKFHALFYKHTPEYFMALSGTPLKNRIPEIYSMLLLWAHAGVKPAITDKYKSFYTFCCRFTNVVQGKYGMSYGGMKNVDELKEYLKPNSIKNPASVLDLPELTEQSIVASYKDSPELHKAFTEFTGARFTAEIGIKVQSAVAKAVFTSNYVAAAIESGEGPVVVFSDHRKPIEVMELELSNLRVRSITGDTPMHKRQEYVDMFNNNQLDVILGTYGAMSTGINLTASNLMVLNDLPWTVSELEQAKKRSHRLGQKRSCRIVHIIGSSVDDLILKTLNAKMKVIAKVMA